METENVAGRKARLFVQDRQRRWMKPENGRKKYKCLSCELRRKVLRCLSLLSRRRRSVSSCTRKVVSDVVVEGVLQAPDLKLQFPCHPKPLVVVLAQTEFDAVKCSLQPDCHASSCLVLAAEIQRLKQKLDQLPTRSVKCPHTFLHLSTPYLVKRSGRLPAVHKAHVGNHCRQRQQLLT
jgi:hypothetical protein